MLVKTNRILRVTFIVRSISYALPAEKTIPPGSLDLLLPGTGISPLTPLSFLVQDHANRYNKAELLKNGDHK
jgi:hypothetical protein